MTRLCQVVALEAGIRNKASQLTEDYKSLQREQPVSGLSRIYEPVAEDGERLPPESTRVQLTVEGVIASAEAALTRLWDITATRDWANCEAKADVHVPDVPVTYLLFLAKQIKDLRAVIAKMPVHGAADVWVPADAPGVWRTDPPVVTNRTRKVPRNHVKAEATDRHPAQVDVYFEDVTVGRWTAVKFTGAISEKRQAALLARCDRLAEAVSNAREEANSMLVRDVRTGEQVLGWLFR
jgi:hypothetical protein